MYATMSGWWTVSTVGKSRALNASSPFFISASRRAVRLVSVVVGMMTPFSDRGLVEVTKCLRVVGGELFEGARGQPAHLAGGSDEDHCDTLLEFTIILVSTPTILARVYSGLRAAGGQPTLRVVRARQLSCPGVTRHCSAGPPPRDHIGAERRHGKPHNQ